MLGFIAYSIDMVIVVDNTTWCGVHIYAIDSWQRILYLVYLSHVFNGSTSNHLIEVIMEFLLIDSELTCEEVTSKVVCFGVDGVSTF